MKLVELLADAYPYGCRGDVKKLDGKALENLERMARARRRPALYRVIKPKSKQGESDGK